MRHIVRIMPRAEAEIRGIHDYIAQRAPQAALRWTAGIFKAILSLEDQPRRFATADESSDFTYELRQFLYGRKRNYRVIYTIQENVVSVLAVRHASQDSIHQADFSDWS